MQVVLIAAQSLDGRITRHDIPGSGFTSEADKQYFRNVLRDFDARVMGSTTYETTREGTRQSATKGRYHAVLTGRPEKYESDAIQGALEFLPLPPAALVQTLEQKGFKRCALIGGSKVHSSFLAAGLIDEFWITIEPLLFGTGTPLLAKSTDIRLRLLSNEGLSADTLLLKYSVVRA
jgi:dihydrofolate reductase